MRLILPHTLACVSASVARVLVACGRRVIRLPSGRSRGRREAIEGGHSVSQRGRKENITCKLPVKLATENRLTIGAGEGNRTLVCSLGSCRSAIELRPQSRCFRISWRDLGVRNRPRCHAKIGRDRPDESPCHRALATPEKSAKCGGKSRPTSQRGRLQNENAR